MHAFDAVDLLLKRDCYRRFNHVCVRAYVVAGHRDLRWRQIRVQRNGERGN